MEWKCPECGQKVRHYNEKKYLYGDLARDIYATAYNELCRYDCRNLVDDPNRKYKKVKCFTSFLVQVEIPQNTVLEKKRHLLEDGWHLWQNALSFKPGKAKLEPFVGDHTRLIKRDTAKIYEQLLKRMAKAQSMPWLPKRVCRA